MGLIESLSQRDSAAVRSPATASSVGGVSGKQRSLKSEDTSQAYLFYDVNKNSVGIVSGNDTIVRKFQAGNARPLPAAGHGQRPGLTRVCEAAPPPSAAPRYDNLVNINCGQQRAPSPPPYEVTLGRDEMFLPHTRPPCFGSRRVPRAPSVSATSSGYGSLSSATNDENCNYTCHDRCQGLVTLNCKTQTTELGSEFFEVKCEESPALLFCSDQPRGAELRQKIEKYNSNSCAQGYEMEMQEDGETFHGFIRVHMNLSRPINVLAGCRPPSIYDIIYEEEDSAEKTLTSFYLPRDTVKALHVTSEMTTQELISALLRKFKVVDNPRKYCLYEKYWEGEGSVKGVLRRMLDLEKPVWLVLNWGLEGMVNRKLVLQENDTGDIMWEAFTLPELSNFLKILDREEEEYLNQVHLKYKKMETKLSKAMKRFESPDQSASSLDDDDDDNEDADEGGFLSARPTLAFFDGSR